MYVIAVNKSQEFSLNVRRLFKCFFSTTTQWIRLRRPVDVFFDGVVHQPSHLSVRRIRIPANETDEHFIREKFCARSHSHRKSQARCGKKVVEPHYSLRWKTFLSFCRKFIQDIVYHFQNGPSFVEDTITTKTLLGQGVPCNYRGTPVSLMLLYQCNYQALDSFQTNSTIGRRYCPFL